MTSSPLKISVVTVSYNAAATIEATLLSVLNQTYNNFEYILIDGGSNDGTVDIIKKYSDRIAYWVSEPDKGIYDAMNKGIAVATGDYINFMNAGDTFVDTNVLAEVAEEIFRNFGVTILYGDSIYSYKYGNVVVPAYDIKTIHKRLPFCHQCAFVKTTVHKDRLFDTSYKYCADYKFTYDTIVKYKESVCHINAVIAKYEAESGFSSTSQKKTLLELSLVRNENPTACRLFFQQVSITWILAKDFVRRILPGSWTKRLQQIIHR